MTDAEALTALLDLCTAANLRHDADGLVIDVCTRHTHDDGQHYDDRHQWIWGKA